MLIWAGVIIVLLTIAGIIKRLETRMVLLVAGFLMAALAGKPMAAVDEFVKTMLHPSLVPVICTVMGFSFVMKATGCDSHLVHLLAGALKKVRIILVPGSVFVTFAINIALPSAAGCAAAVGSILIPAMTGAGIHPAIAASAVLAGTWGSVMSPGATHNPFVAKLANTDVMTVIATLFNSALAALVVVAACLTVVAYLRKETGTGAAATGPEAKPGEDAFKVNPLKAVVPLVPLALLVLGSKQVALIPEVSVPLAMLSGVVLGTLVCWHSPRLATIEFFKGAGDSYASIIGIIIAAAVFAKGMELIGLTGTLIDAMKNSQSIAKLAATFGPFAMAILSGSGDAATLAFNGSITPHAATFGYGIIEMGSTAQIAGALGRSMSPVAGAAIVCAGIAGVNTIEITKRNAAGMILGAITVMFILM